ncbi:carboxylesterase/lipase family protein [Kutzneria buriramensis]|uniref:Carboxylic ester hydrolase n=1 Tax=Kutzneria buriramensis TaxID=1045776 RepID=A0A3E0GW82_9PSEU|nr:carboxylesterase family protein [Kutzneria buriramensis]REH27771.1 para-nitrobenzyl esterase [Kutzneria buriramensis]
MWKGIVVALLGGVLTLANAVPAAAAPDHPAPVARVETGLLRGSDTAGVDSFLGIPYAAPPVGQLRWRPPQPATSWPGVREATAYGNRCAAAASGNGPRSETEDCLFLNVQRPSFVHSGQKAPVYFWIHGGGLQNGSSDQHDGSLIASRTGAVVVTINYRLGAFGFLAHPGLTAEGAGQSGDYGLLDQQAALRWVQRNIAAFGGDPRQVTIGGESAGGWSVCAHLTAPGSRGLFRAAMIQSGSCYSQTLTQAETSGTSAAQALGCTDPATAVACLRAIPASRLVDTQVGAEFVHGVPALPQAPDLAVHTGNFARVPVVVGANRDEGRTFALGFLGQTREAYEAFVRAAFPDRADTVLARYPWPADSDRFTAAYQAGAIYTDAGLVARVGGCPDRDLVHTFARYTRTYAYEFDHRDGPGLTPIPGYVWGAGHAAELAYLWPSFDNGTPIAPTFNAAERRLARDMVDAWGAFVRDGRPGAAGWTAWPSFNGSDQVMSLRTGGSTLVSDHAIGAEHNCDLWNSPGQAGEQ